MKANGQAQLVQQSVATFHGAIQPSGYYFERRVPPVPGHVRPDSADEKGAGGISEDYFWGAYWQGDSTGAERDLTLDPRRPPEGGSEKNGSRAAIENYRNLLEYIRFLGFPPLRTNSFELAKNGQFAAIAVDGTRVRGNIVRSEDDLPLELVYFYGSGSNVSVNVRYMYHNSQPIPDYFEYKIVTPDRPPGEIQTNWIDRVEYGLDEKIQSGYPPSILFDVKQFTHTILWSNGVDYSLLPDGEMIPIHRSMPPVHFANSTIERPKLARGIMGTMVFVSAIFAWVGLRRARNKRNE